MKKYFLLLIITVVISINGKAQIFCTECVDSQWNIINHDTSGTKTKADAYYAILNEIIYSRPDSALSVAQEALNFSVAHDSIKYIYFLSRLISAYNDLGYKEIQFELIQKAIRISVRTNDSLRHAGYLLNSGIQIKQLKDTIAAIEIYEKALSSVPYKGYEVMGLIYLNMSVLYRTNKKFIFGRKAIFYLEKKLYENQLKGLETLYRPIITAYYNYSNFLKNSDSADFYLQRAYDMAITQNVLVMQSACLQEMSLKALKKGDFKKALSYGKKALALADTLQDIYEKFNSHEVLTKVYLATGDTVKAFTSYYDFIKLRDSISNIERHGEILNIQYKAKVTENELKLKKLQVQEKFKRFRDRLLLITLSVFIILSILVYYRLRFLKIRNEKNELLYEISELKQKLWQRDVVTQTEVALSNKLNRELIEKNGQIKLNDSDWKILNVLYEDPLILNKLIAEKVSLSLEGASSALRKMYKQFEISESQNKKLALLKRAIELSHL